MVANPNSDKLSYIFPQSLDEASEVDHSLRLQRLNVGFSRAKEQIHIFHSMPIEKYRGAIGQALLHYKRELERGYESPTTNDTDRKSPMEMHVLSWLQQTEFYRKLYSAERIDLHAQFELGAYLKQLDPTYNHPLYRVDFLLNIHNGARAIPIIVEYDGFKEHFTRLAEVGADNYEEYMRPQDVERQKVIESYGYRFLRINRFNLGRDPIKTLNERLIKLVPECRSSH